MAIEQTLIIVKPDGLVKSLTGNILSRLAEAHMIIIGAKVVKMSRELGEKHYSNMLDHPNFEEIMDYMQGKPYGLEYRRVIAFVYQGEEAIQRIRDIVGSTNPELANPVTIRGAYGRITTSGLFENVVHASSSIEESEREIKLWFNPAEITEDIYPAKEGVLDDCKTKIWA